MSKQTKDKVKKIEISGKNVNVDTIYVTLNNIKNYKKVTYDDNEYEVGKDKFKIDFIGKFEFDLDINNGKPICAESVGVKNRSMRIGYSFFKEHFREQVPTIEKECKKGFNSVIKQLRNIRFK